MPLREKGMAQDAVRAGAVGFVPKNASVEQVIGAGGRSREGWDGTIDDMTSYGMNITPAERGLVLEYLATYLPYSSRP